MTHARRSRQRGVSLIELSVAAVVLTVALLLVIGSSVNNVTTLQGMADSATQSARLGEIVHGIEKMVRGACGFRPAAFLGADISDSEEGAVTVDTLRGFPGCGRLVIDPATSSREFIDYDTAVHNDGIDYTAFETLTRGARTGTSQVHTAGAAVRWGAFGEVVPIASTAYDGESNSTTGPVRFRGEGTGFVFQGSVDVSGSRVRGANVRGTAYEDGWTAIYFEPVSELVESERSEDLNGDGDLDDVFDLGRLRRRSWAPITTTQEFVDVAISPTILAQEQGAWGTADLDRDGVSDPMFLWHEDAAKLQIQLVIWTSADGTTGRFSKLESLVRLDRTR